ncbi:hypothetical protein ABPG72_018544 [Tetrahymena utriculariae]
MNQINCQFCKIHQTLLKSCEEKWETKYRELEQEYQLLESKCEGIRNSYEQKNKKLNKQNNFEQLQSAQRQKELQQSVQVQELEEQLRQNIQIFDQMIANYEQEKIDLQQKNQSSKKEKELENKIIFLESEKKDLNFQNNQLKNQIVLLKAQVENPCVECRQKQQIKEQQKTTLQSSLYLQNHLKEIINDLKQQNKNLEQQIQSLISERNCDNQFDSSYQLLIRIKKLLYYLSALSQLFCGNSNERAAICQPSISIEDNLPENFKQQCKQYDQNEDKVKEYIKHLSSQGYTFLNILGKGSFGLVIKKSKHILQIKNALEAKLTNPVLFIFTDLCQGELTTLIEQKITKKQMISIMMQLLMGLEELKEMKVIHMDQKPENILFNKIGDSYHIYIADFGQAKQLQDKEYTENLTRIGTMKYVSKEIIEFDEDEDDKLKITNQVNIYSLGIVFIELVFGRKFNFKTEVRPIRQGNLQIFNVRQKTKNRDFDQTDDFLIDNIIKNMIQQNPESRKSSDELLNIVFKIFTKTFNQNQMSFFEKCLNDFSRKQ